MLNTSSRHRLTSGLLAIGVVLLAACSSPVFENPPPKSYLSAPPASLNGIWANEVKNGARVRLKGKKNGSLRMDFLTEDLSPDPQAPKPLNAQIMRFDDTDWLLLDWRKLGEAVGEKSDAGPPYRILKYTLQGTDRLCGTEINPAVFAEGIESGQLTGTVGSNGSLHHPANTAAVTSPGKDWVEWWIALPAEKKTFGETFCFRRYK